MGGREVQLTGWDAPKGGHHRRGEARASYDAVATAYDGFAHLWDGYIAAPALEHYNLLIRQHVRPGALVLDAGAGAGERMLALLRNSQEWTKGYDSFSCVRS